MIYLAWKVLGTLSRFRWPEKHDTQNNFISQFKLWALAPLEISASLCEGSFYLLYAIFIFTWVSIFSYKAPTKGHYDRTWALGVANMRVFFMNGSMIEHNGLGITCFSVDILKDMIACWYAWVLESSCQNNTIALNHIKVHMSMLQKKRICDEHVRQHSTSKILFLSFTYWRTSKN